MNSNHGVVISKSAKGRWVVQIDTTAVAIFVDYDQAIQYAAKLINQSSN